MIRRPYRSPLLILAALVVLTFALAAVAANKAATLVPPADYTAGGWQIVVAPESAEPGQTATRWCATTRAVAFDNAVGARDVFSHTVCTSSPPGDITAFVNARLAAARTANGY